MKAVFPEAYRESLPYRHRLDIAEALALFCEQSGRDLPWRKNKTPYRVYVSEVMLQQTRTETVLRYYEPFLIAYPTVTALADADGDALRKQWEGLGYYRRIALAQKACLDIKKRYGGEIPADYAALRALPGFGDYTASAVASFAFGLRAAAVDGNLLRVLARLFAFEGNILEAKNAALLRAVAEEMLPPPKHGSRSERKGGALHEKDGGAAATWNQAMMELGAQVCLPNTQPHCHACPLSPYCLACAGGCADALPVRESGTKRRHEEKTVLRIKSGNRYLIRRRPDTGLLAGFYELPTADGTIGTDGLSKILQALGIFSAFTAEPLPAAKHVFTHITWHMTGYEITLAEEIVPPQGMLFASLNELNEVHPIPSAFRAYRPTAKGNERHES